ncbi:hypothetical protein IWW45_007407 [Coemansia sp. RSA 485]|nr:hypothetical protein IWW45_007407 [Coemansia sp. RSA 485]
MPVGFALAMAMQSNPNSSKWLFIFASALSLFVAILLLLLVPNSPRDLIYRGQLEKAKDVVKMLARPEMLSETEVSSQVRTLTKVIKSEAAPRFRDLFSRANRRSLAVACTLQVAKQVSGFNVLQSFSGYVFKIIGLAKGSTLQVPTILLGTVQLICAVASLGIVDILGRRKLLLLSTLVMAMGLVVLGGSFVMITGFDQITKSRCEEYIRCGSCLLDTKCGWSAEADKCMLQQPPTMGSPVLLDSCPLSTTRERVGSWVAVCSFILSLGAMSLGLGSIPWIIQSEMLSSSDRAPSQPLSIAQQTSPTTSPLSKRRHVLRYLSNGLKKLLPSGSVSTPVTDTETGLDSDTDGQIIPSSYDNMSHNAVSIVMAASAHDLDEAATIIQRAWRRAALKHLVTEWSKLDFTVKRLSDLSFDDATKVMQSAEMIQASANLLSVLLMAAPESDKSKNPGRAFIAAHLFAAHPQLLATGNAHIDTMTESSATTMTETFAQFEEAFLGNDNSWYRRQQTFIAGFRAFYFALDSWKRSDTRKMLATMERHYLELDRLWQSVQRKTLGEGDESWRVGIQIQREQLLSKVRTLGGDGAVDELIRRQKELRLTYDDPQPSPTPSLIPPPQSAYSPIIEAQPPPAADVPQQRSSSISDEQRHSAVTNATDRGKAAVLSNSADTDSSDTSDPSVVLTKAIADRATHNIDQVLGSFDLTAASALQDAKLAHEIILDPELRLEPAPDNTLVGAVQKAVTKAFFEHIKQDIESGNSDYIIRTLSQLRLDLRTIIPPDSEAHAVVEREFDQDWLTKQLTNGALDIRQKYRLVLNAIRSVCAPARDPEIENLASSLEAVDDQGLKEISRSVSNGKRSALSDDARKSVDELLLVTQKIMELIRNVRMDVLNYQLATVVRPWLRVHAVEYERAATNKALREQYNNDRSQITHCLTEWMKPAFVREKTNQCTLQAQKIADQPPSAKHVFFESFLDLCFSASTLSAEATPATFKMDRLRIHQMQNEVQTLLCTAALCVLAKSFTAMSDSQMRQAAQLFLSILRADDVTIDQIVRGMQETIPRCEQQLVRRLVRKTLAKEDPVYQVMELKLRRFLLTQLEKEESPGGLGRRLFGDGRKDIAAELAKTTLDVVGEEICKLLLRMSQLCLFNWQVYSGWYSQALHSADVDSDAHTGAEQ